MTLRKKTLLIVSATFLSLTLILFFISETILLDDFVELEERSTRLNVERVLSALSDELSDLNATTGDWAGWDDTYAFIEDANDEYTQSNLIDATFIELRVNLMMFIHSSGQIVFSKAFDLDNEEEVAIPQSLHRHLSPDELLVTHPDTESSISGIVLLPEGPMLVASEPILTSEDEGPIRGTLIMGRYLDAAEIELLAEETHLSFTIHQFIDSQAPPELQAVRSSLSNEAPIVVQTLDEESVAGYTLLKDIYEKPSLVLRVDMPRDIYKQGQTSVAYLILSIVGVGLVLSLVTMLLLEKQVLTRLSRLIKGVSSIGASGDISERVSMPGEDELSNLASTINGMLAALQESGGELHELYQHEKDLRHKLEEEILKRIDFTRALVHELKTPITPVLASSELLLEELKEEPSISLAQNIQRGASNLNRRIDELLDLAKGEIGTLQVAPVSADPVQLLNNIANDVIPLALLRKQTMAFELPPSLPAVWVDPDRFQQIVLNLINNALKFSPRGGTITLRAREEGDNLVVEVEDRGRGISKKDQQRIFEPYHRSETDRGRLSGLGLGLALSKRLAELHRGRIWVKSSVGKGSTFGFSLPLTATNEREENVKREGKS